MDASHLCTIIEDTAKIEWLTYLKGMHGLNEEACFEKMESDNITDEGAVRVYFSTDMSPVTIGENEVFVLIDQWWCGTDSKDYDPLRMDQIIGVVKGYAQ